MCVRQGINAFVLTVFALVCVPTTHSGAFRQLSAVVCASGGRLFNAREYRTIHDLLVWQIAIWSEFPVLFQFEREKENVMPFSFVEYVYSCSYKPNRCSSGQCNLISIHYLTLKMPENLFYLFVLRWNGRQMHLFEREPGHVLQWLYTHYVCEMPWPTQHFFHVFICIFSNRLSNVAHVNAICLVPILISMLIFFSSFCLIKNVNKKKIR